jgi:hypothetical protein
MNRKQMIAENKRRQAELRAEIREREQINLETDELLASLKRKRLRQMHYKTMDNGSMIQPRPQQVQDWDRWCKTHVNNGLDELARVIGEETGKIEARLNKRISELEAEIGQLRAQTEILRNAAVGAPVDLPGSRTEWRQ